MQSDFPTFEDLCSTANNELFTKTSTFSNYMHFSQHDPPHNNDTASHGVHTPFSSLDTSPVFLIVISLLVCCIQTVISFCIFLYIVYFCTLFIGLHFVIIIYNIMCESMSNQLINQHTFTHWTYSSRSLQYITAVDKIQCETDEEDDFCILQ